MKNSKEIKPVLQDAREQPLDLGKLTPVELDRLRKIHRAVIDAKPITKEEENYYETLKEKYQ